MEKRVADYMHAMECMQELKSVPLDDGEPFGDGQVDPRSLLCPLSRSKGLGGWRGPLNLSSSVEGTNRNC